MRFTYFRFNIVTPNSLSFDNIKDGTSKTVLVGS